MFADVTKGLRLGEKNVSEMDFWATGAKNKWLEK